MPTYKEIQEQTKKSYNFTPKTCWIADILDDHGRTKRMAPNRIDENKRKHPCPPHRRDKLETIMREMGALNSD